MRWQTGAYRIVNAVNGKVYVGGAYRSFAGREAAHWAALAKGRHHNRHLQRAYAKHGRAAFHFEVLERCAPGRVEAVEQKWLDRLRPWERGAGYNVCRTAERLTWEDPEFKAEVGGRISATLTGRKLSPEALARRTAKQRPVMVARNKSPENRAKVSATRMGHEVTADTRAKISASLTGRPLSVETRAKLRAAQNRPETVALKSAKAKQAWTVMSPEKRARVAATGKINGKKNRGEGHGAAVLTDAKVREARRLRADDPKYWSYGRLQKRYGCGYLTIYKAVNGITWGHVSC